MDAEVVPYHWDNRKILLHDYIYLQDMYEGLLKDLAVKLNSLHGVNHSLRYWRILVGPWLGYFIQMLFDRWTMISCAINQHSISGVRILATQPAHIIPSDMDHFQALMVTDLWNEAIYAELLQGWTSIPIEKIQPPVSLLRHASSNISFSRHLKRMIAQTVSFSLQILRRESDVFFLSSYLPVKQDFSLQLHFGQIPKLWRPVRGPREKIDFTKRQWLLEDKGTVGFPAILRALIPRHIPTLYLEGYKSINAFCESLPWPAKPRLIFTSNAYNSDDTFKVWAAHKVESGTPLIVGQHGGTYGISQWDFSEEHQCAISDAWLSWGWDDVNNQKVKPIGNFKIMRRNLIWDPQGIALLVETTAPRYSYRMFSLPVASQWLDYFNDQFRFVAALPQDLREQLVVRLYAEDYEWCQKQRWQERFPQIQLDNGRKSIMTWMKKSRLYISTYNATTFLESLTLNIPTLIFWNPHHWELRTSAQPYFQQLKQAGIFHDTPESAASQMSVVWDDVPGWWNRPEIQQARRHFCERFSRNNQHTMHVLKSTLSDIAGKKSQ